ncbi:MAG: hypothetical protein IKF78_09655 [Atopobiaceae bacterium]|nr:hypothetical protein [Atopobiaceae bacterium]
MARNKEKTRVTQNRRTPWLADTILNVLLVVLETGALIVRFSNSDLSMFQYYTQCSNLLAAIAGVVCLAANAGKVNAAHAHVLKFCACATQLMTFVVVVFVLVPMINSTGQNGFQYLFLTGVMPVTHLLGPALTILSYLLYEREPLPRLRECILALTPTLTYALVAYTCNYFRVFEGPYPFFLVWNMPFWQTSLWFVVLLAAASALIAILWFVTTRLRTHKR